MNFSKTYLAFNIHLSSMGYSIPTIGDTYLLVSAMYNIYAYSSNYTEYSNNVLVFNGEYYNHATDNIEQCYIIDDTEIHLSPVIFNDLLYGYFYMLHWECNCTSFDLVSSILNYCDFGLFRSDFRKVLSLCNHFSNDDISELQSEFLVWYALQLYPFINQKFTLSEITDSICNLDLVNGRTVKYVTNNTLLNYGCYKNVNNVYIQIP